MSPRSEAPNGGAAPDRHATTLAALPALLDLAREILVAGFLPDDEDAESLRRRVEECAVDAHRLLLARQIGSRAKGGDQGRSAS